MQNGYCLAETAGKYPLKYAWVFPVSRREKSRKEAAYGINMKVVPTSVICE